MAEGPARHLFERLDLLRDAGAGVRPCVADLRRGDSLGRDARRGEKPLLTVTRSQYGPAAGASGGATPKPTRLRAPKFVRLSGAELDALYNRAGHELAGSLYLLLLGGCVLSGKSVGQFLGSYARLQALLRPPKPERGQWAPPPTLKRVRTALAALELAGLVGRDCEGNAAQGQLRLRLLMRETP